MTTKAVTVVGPNIPGASGGFHVHRTGCADLRRNYLYLGRQDENEDLDVANLKEVVEFFYGPDAGSFYEESGLDPDNPDNWLRYAGEFKVFPCIDLPDDEETTT